MEKIASWILSGSKFVPRNDEDQARALFLCAFSLYFFLLLGFMVPYLAYKDYHLMLGAVLVCMVTVISAPILIRNGGSSNTAATLLFGSIYLINTVNAFFFGGELEVNLTVWYFIFILGISLFFGKETGLYALMLVMTTASVLVTLDANGISFIHPILDTTRQSYINIPFKLLVGFLFLRYMVNHFLEIHQSASQKLFKSQQLYNLIADNYPNGAISVVDKNFKISYIKGRALEEMGAVPSDFIGKTPFEIRPEAEAKIENAAYAKAFAGKHNDFELDYKGQTYSFICEPLVGDKGAIDQILVVSQNITKIRLAQEELQAAKASLEAIINNSRHLIFSIDRNLTVKVSNQNGRVQGEVKGYEYLVSGINLRNLPIPPELLEGWQERYKRAFSGEAFTEEFEQGGHDWEVSLNPISEYGRVTGAAVFVRDIDQRKQEERELREAKQKAENAAQAKADFLSTMSHEIRTPLNAVIGLTHLLLHEEPQEHQLENLRTLKFSAENLLSLINDILDFSKIESGKVSFEEADFSLQDHLKGIYSSMAYKAREKGIGFNLLLDSQMPPHLSGDPARLAQVLNNLIGNAIKFTQKGEVTVRVSIAETANDRIKLDFSVADTGIGIPANKMDSIFDSFTQAETNTTRRFGGTGLGLAITRKLLHLQGSEITVESTEGQGTVFGFSLWFGRASNRLPVYGYASHLPTEPFLNGLSVLVAEDNEINRLIIKKFLVKWGLQPQFAENGVEALALLSNKTFDMVLMDLQMPVMDGFEATRQIRLLPGELANIPIIGLTADSNVDIRAITREAGMNDVITKPFNPNEVFAILVRNTSARKMEKNKPDEGYKALKPEWLLDKLLELNDGDETYTALQCKQLQTRLQALIIQLNESGSSTVHLNQGVEIEIRKLKDVLTLFGLQEAADDLLVLQDSLPNNGKVEKEVIEGLLRGLKVDKELVKNNVIITGYPKFGKVQG